MILHQSSVGQIRTFAPVMCAPENDADALSRERLVNRSQIWYAHD